MDEARTEIARFLRQRVELGSSALFLDGHARIELFEALSAVESEAAPRPTHPRRDTATGVARERSGATSPSPAPASARPSRAPTPSPGTGTGSPISSPDAGKKPSEAAPLPEAILPDRYDALQELALACERCALAEGRTHVVFGDGNPDARVMVVGEAPGANEDRTGLPFVGQAGKLLDLLLASVDLSREESVYICNVIKCRPPGNRNPRPEEIEACAPFLRRQIEIVAPEVILAVGTFAAQLLTGRKAPLGKLRGEVYRYDERPLIVTYHPAALLRNSGWTRATWDDLQLLRRTLDEC